MIDLRNLIWLNGDPEHNTDDCYQIVENKLD